MFEAKPKPFKTTAISLIVVRKDDTYCCTDEKYGWYLPAGRVDFGESFDVAAKRECIEEAGLKVNLKGIMRMEYSFQNDFMRLRCIFNGDPSDPNAPLKSVPDDETYGAAWMKYEDLIKLARQDSQVLSFINSLPYRKNQPKRKKKDFIRGHEILHLFRWEKQKTTIFPNRILESIPGVVDNNRVETQMNYSVQIVVSNPVTQKFLMVTKPDSATPWKLSLPVQNMTKLEEFKNVAHAMGKQLNPLIGGVRLRTQSICGVYHKAPQSLSGESPGQFTPTFMLEPMEGTIDEQAHPNFVWKSGQELMEIQDHELESASETRRIITNVMDGVLPGIDFLAWEGQKYVPL